MAVGLVVAIDARLVGGSSTGDTTYWNGLLYGLSRLEPSARVLLFSNAERPSGIPWYDGFEWIRVPSGSSRWWSMVSFPLAARRLGAKVLHTQYNLSPLAGRRGVTTIHDVSFFIGPEWFRPRDLMLLRRFVPLSAARAARVVTVSETSKSEIERFIPAARGKIAVTHLAPSPGIVPMVAEEACRTVRDALALERPFLLTVGTRWPRKNMSLAIAASDGLPERFPHLLVVTGKAGWGADEEDGRRVVPTGYVDQHLLSALYSSAAMTLVPSRHEGFGLPVVEAFACGCPVLASTGGALPEVAAGAAEIVPSWEPADWTAALEATLDDSSKLDAMRTRGLERARAFDWRETAQRTLEVYREVAG